MTGVDALAALPKTSSAELYSTAGPSGPHEPMCGRDLVEPSKAKGFPILEALPEYESELFSKEENIVERAGECQVAYEQIVRRYSFVGGEEEEYLICYGRSDVQYQWTYRKRRDVKAVNGLTRSVSQSCVMVLMKTKHTVLTLMA